MDDELEIEIDGIEILIHGHLIDTCFKGYVTFTPRKQIVSIDQQGDWSVWKRKFERVEVCPVQSKELYDALYAAIPGQYGDHMDNAIEEWWIEHPENYDRDEPPARRIRDYI